MEQHEKQFENYLGEFQPKRPRALPTEIEHKQDWRRLAAAALTLVAVGASWFAAQRKSPNGSGNGLERVAAPLDGSFARLSLTSLTKLAMEHPERLDAALTEASRHTLPGFRGKESTLRVLAQE